MKDLCLIEDIEHIKISLDKTSLKDLSEVKEGDFVELHDPSFYPAKDVQIEQEGKIQEIKECVGEPPYRIFEIYKTDKVFLTIQGLKGRMDLNKNYFKKVIG